MAVRDFVFALSLCRQNDDGQGKSFIDFLGSGFLIGDQGYALTAAHVLPEIADSEIAALFVIDDAWHGFTVEAFEKHPGQDVAVLKISGGPTRSPFRCRGAFENSGRQYRQFGYPRHLLWEGVVTEQGILLPNPELIYTEGYIRRRVSTNLSIKGVKGNAFFEVNAVAGKGCSGSPLFVNGADKMWEVIGIYSAEKSTKDEDDDTYSVAYATREDSFRDWRPTLLSGSSVMDESRKVDKYVD